MLYTLKTSSCQVIKLSKSVIIQEAPSAADDPVFRRHARIDLDARSSFDNRVFG